MNSIKDFDFVRISKYSQTAKANEILILLFREDGPEAKPSVVKIPRTLFDYGLGAIAIDFNVIPKIATYLRVGPQPMKCVQIVGDKRTQTKPNSLELPVNHSWIE